MKKPPKKHLNSKQVLHADFLSDEDFFSMGSQEPRLKKLLRTVGLFCTVSYTDGVPLMHLDKFCSVLSELGNELAGLRRYGSKLNLYKLPEDTDADLAAEDSLSYGK